MSLQRPQGPRALGESVGKLARAAFRRRGFAAAEVLTRWPDIAGEMLARCTCPEKLTFPQGRADGATLRLRVAPGFAPEVQHLAPLIVERVNTYYGYRAVERLTIVQAPLSARPVRAPRTLPPLSPAQAARLDALLAGIGDAGLRQSLRSLGAAVLAGA